eukprot:scaffold31684_cov69-Phaeocystis_antarctica.AAC.3
MHGDAGGGSGPSGGDGGIAPPPQAQHMVFEWRCRPGRCTVAVLAALAALAAHTMGRHTAPTV